MTGVLGIAQLSTLYGVSLDGPDVEILMRHRAALFGILGGLLVGGAVRKSLRSAALVAGVASLGSFLLLAVSTGGYNAELGRVVAVDVGALLLLVGVAILHLFRPEGRQA